MADPNKRPIIIKKKVVHGVHHGGAWKVAYADFVTAMMALFIVLWLLSSSEKVRQAVGGYFRDPTGRGKSVGTNMDGSGRDMNVLKDDMSGLKEKLQSVIKLVPHFQKLQGNVELTITEEGLRIELIEDSKGIFFESGKPQPSAIGKELLSALAKELGRLPNRILIEGHTDAQKYSGSEVYSNWELSADRANEARRLMESSGLFPDQVAQIRGYADQDLRNKQNPEDPSNRRVSLIVRYTDPPKQLALGGVLGKVQQTQQQPAINPASIPISPATAQKSKH
ncbi:MAG: OmpA family protein [Acidobacteriota bacterium]|nr:OmpA family protein [Acidobacteriota bacterium]